MRQRHRSLKPRWRSSKQPNRSISVSTSQSTEIKHKKNSPIRLPEQSKSSRCTKCTENSERFIGFETSSAPDYADADAGGSDRGTITSWWGRNETGAKSASRPSPPSTQSFFVFLLRQSIRQTDSRSLSLRCQLQSFQPSFDSTLLRFSLWFPFPSPRAGGVCA